jgi:class 3 adenylate cyclase/predicted ATPase
MDVGDWLQGLGLGQYLVLFREHAIDPDVLPDLTDADLEKFGVPFGHRKRLIKAIAKLGAVPAEQAEAPPAPATRLLDASAERRHLTVMFCDLVGSTTISAALDAEDWRNLVNVYLDAASEAVTQMGGHVAKKLGDGIMALFGHPIAQENDAERAVRAALAIQRALVELNRKGQASGAPELVARIGVETGAVVVDSAGEIFGDAPNIAARVEALAEPGTVLATGRVQRQVAGLFVAEDRGAHALKGLPEPTTLYRIVRASGAGRRSGQRALTPLVGRDEEVTMLLRRWERARQGEGQFVQIVGEPGLGKSRLIEEFHARLAETPHTWVEWSSSQLLQNTPLHPIADWGRQRFGGADVASERRLADLEVSLSQVKLDPAEFVPLLAPLVDVPLPPERGSPLPPEELRRRQMAALNAWVTAGARTQPIVLAFEDLHWADPTTLDVLRGFAERGALAPLLVIATTRPEFRAPWGTRSHHGTITLAPLDRAQVRQMVGEIASRNALSGDVIEGVNERTGGVPLFVEEVTRLILERGGQGGAQAIPPTLQQSLAARLDRLGPAREAAMIGAVIGRGFSFSLLRAVAGMDDALLHDALEKLAEAGILLVEGLPPDSDYRFKHALIQDAAYENLLKSRRQALHRRVAETLRDQFPDRADAQPEVLAHHFTQAGRDEEAIGYWGRAGDQALRRSAFQEAIAHLGKAIEMADKEGEAGSASRRLKLQTSYGLALNWSRGYISQETQAAFARAQELAAGSDNIGERFATYYGKFAPSFIRGDMASAREIAETFLREASSQGEAPDLVGACRMVGLARLFQGDFAGAGKALEEVLRNYNPEWDSETRERHGLDSGIAAMAYLAHVHWQFGEVEHAKELIEQAMRRALASNHVPTLATTYIFAILLEVVRGKAEGALRVAETLVEIAGRNELAWYLAVATLYQSWARARLDGRQADPAELGQALTRYTEQGNRSGTPLIQGLLAELEAEGQDASGALARIDEALGFARHTGERWTDVLLHRIRGDILLKADPENPARAADAYLTAIAIAREQGARSFGLRAGLALAKLYQSTGRSVEAYDILAPAFESFSLTPEMPEIAEAEALLGELPNHSVG